MSAPFEIRIAGTGVAFPCDPGQNILDAALRAGIDMPYSCRKGVCGNCAAGIASGAVRCPPSDVAPAGQHLLCQCLPEGDVDIVPASWHRADPAARKTFVAKVFRNLLAAPDVSILQLRLPAGQRARFKAGQYLQVLLPDGSRRSYSMANPPHQSDTIQLHIRHVRGGQFTQVVQQLKPGDALKLELPFGHVALQEDAATPLLCVVGGTGFAPVKSLLDDLARKGAQRPVTLVWGGRDRQGIYLPAALEPWQRLWPQFTFLPALEDAADARAMGGFHGRVDDALRAMAPAPAPGQEVYCCGSPAMVAAVRRVCVEEQGLDAACFHSDVFVPGPAA